MEVDPTLFFAGVACLLGALVIAAFSWSRSEALRSSDLQRFRDYLIAHREMAKQAKRRHKLFDPMIERLSRDMKGAGLWD